MEACFYTFESFLAFAINYCCFVCHSTWSFIFFLFIILRIQLQISHFLVRREFSLERNKKENGNFRLKRNVDGIIFVYRMHILWFWCFEKGKMKTFYISYILFIIFLVNLFTITDNRIFKIRLFSIVFKIFLIKNMEN